MITTWMFFVAGVLFVAAVACSFAGTEGMGLGAVLLVLGSAPLLGGLQASGVWAKPAPAVEARECPPAAPATKPVECRCFCGNSGAEVPTP